VVVRSYGKGKVQKKGKHGGFKGKGEEILIGCSEGKEYEGKVVVL